VGSNCEINVEHRMLNRPVPIDAKPLASSESPPGGSFHEKETEAITSEKADS
jgi:hypothetical protein